MTSLLLLTACRDAETATVQDAGPKIDLADSGDPTDTAKDSLPDKNAPDVGVDAPAPPTTWIQGPDLAHARTHHTATLLAGGRLLVIGGIDNPTMSGMAEIYDSASGTWSTAGEMKTPRAFHTAHLLSDGRVFIVGGAMGTSITDIETGTEFFDPEAPVGQQWTKGPPMAVERRSHCAVTLNDGRVFVAGGHNNLGDQLSIEIFDPQSNSWSSSATVLDRPRSLSAATLLESNKVLISGGGSASGTTNSLAVFDPTAGTITKLSAKLTSARFGHESIRLHDGRVFIAGGICEQPTGFCAVTVAEIFDPVTDTMVGAGGLNSGEGLKAVLLADGRIMITGGLQTKTTAKLFDPEGPTWSTLPSIPRPYYNHTATRLSDNSVILVAGSSFAYEGQATVDILQ